MGRTWIETWKIDGRDERNGVTGVRTKGRKEREERDGEIGRRGK